VKARRRRLPGYIGTVYWGFSIWFMGFATWETLKDGEWWAVPFGITFLLLFAACLWFYGFLPWRTRDDERHEAADP
jgi:hypothetical protein